MKTISIDPLNIDYSLIREAADFLSRGKIIALPTETVYGLAAITDKPETVDKLYEIKGRSKEKPFTYALDSSERALRDYFITLSPFGYRLMERFWPGPLSIVYHSKDGKRVGVRVPSHEVAREVIKNLGAAVYLPSANKSGQKEAVSAQEVEESFGQELDLIVDGGTSTYGQPSTVVDITFSPYKILRQGVIAESEILKTFIKKRILFVCTGNTCRSPMAQYLFEKYLREAKPYLIGRYEIISRGTGALTGAKPTSNVFKILKVVEGIDASDFISRRIDRRTILSSDHIFTMDDNQARYIMQLEPSAEGRVFALKKFLPPELERDIPDPIGKDIEVYEEAFFLIKKAILELREWL
ncbi:MAG: threonylcarbamoyl-AMP synthase [Candidatus Omnitrophota bacterium]|nr:MAG: threonylcarbamoyl-AMP synthase [Candidatus Omnitrophota bacterium]